MTPRWFWKFLGLVIRDTLKFFPEVVKYLSGIKIVKFFILTLFTGQLIYFLNKFLIYFNFSVNWKEVSSLLLILFAFPLVFTYEKFLSGSIFGLGYDKGSTDNFWQTAKEKFQFYGKPKRAWLVYLLSQASALIDVVVFSAIFTAVLFLGNFNFKDLDTWFLIIFIGLSFGVLLIIAVFLWNRSFQVFRFWDKNEDVWQALKDSHQFTTKHPRKFITLHTLVKVAQFLIPTLLALGIYSQAGSLLGVLNGFINKTTSVYVAMILLATLGFFVYQILVSFSNVYFFRLAHYFEVGDLDEDYTPHSLPLRRDSKIARIINRSVLSIIFLSFLMFVHFQILNARDLTEKVEVKYPNIIKIYSDGLNSSTTIDSYLTPRYANGIAVSIYTENDELYAQPLVAEVNNPLVPSSLSIADVTFFNLSQTFVPTQVKIPFKDALEFSNARKFTLFIYVKDKESLDKINLYKEKMQSKFTIIFSDGIQLVEEMQNNLSTYRNGTLAKVVDIEEYKFSHIFIFHKDANNKLLQSLNRKNIKTYILLQAGEKPDPTLDLSLVQGVFTDLPQLSYNQVRNISDEDVLKTVILSPIKFFGF